MSTDNGRIEPGAKKMWEYEAYLDRMMSTYGGLCSAAEAAGDMKLHAELRAKFELVHGVYISYIEMCRLAKQEKPAGCVCDLLDKIKLRNPEEPYHESPPITAHLKVAQSD